MKEEDKHDSATEDSINKRLSDIENAIKRIEEYIKDEGMTSQHNQLEQFKLAIDHFYLTANEAKANTVYNTFFAALCGISIGLAISSMGIATDNSFLEIAGWSLLLITIVSIPASYLIFYLIRYFKKTTTKK